MVAYSFKSRFAPPILEGRKCQTIRGARKRHAQEGEPLQLYVGMRTRSCRKIIPDPVCVEVQTIRIDFENGIVFLGDGWIRMPGCLDAFAESDGFRSWDEMRVFWRETHGLEYFEGVLIRWEPLDAVLSTSRPGAL